MKILLSILLVFIFYKSSLAHNEDVHTIQYNTENFDEEIGKKNHFVMFFAPWCGYCQRLAPTWEQLAEMLNEDDSSIRIAKVDCTIDKDICSEHDVTGYPTLKFFKVGEKDGVKFKGTRDLPTLTSFINDQLGNTPSDEKENKSNIPEPVNGLTELTEDNFDKHVSSGKHFIKFYAPWCGHCQKLAPTWEQLAQTLESDNTIGISKIDCTQYRSVCNQFDIKGYPTLLWIEEGKKIDKYQGQRALEDLKQYVSTMMGGSDVRSETEPFEDAPNAVLILTGDDFDAGVQTGVSFVKFFAPWCGHCKRLAPTWDDLGKKFMSNPSVHIIKVDCTVESSKQLCNDQEVDGFPTLFIYKNGEKISEYRGSRSLEDLQDFVNKHIGHDEL